MEEKRTNQTTVANRRASPRRPPKNSIKVACRKGAMGLGPNLAEAFLDISETGVKAILKSPLPLKQEVEVTIEGMGFKAIKRLGNVVRVDELEDGRCAVGVRLQSPIPYSEIQKLVRPS